MLIEDEVLVVCGCCVHVGQVYFTSEDEVSVVCGWFVYVGQVYFTPWSTRLGKMKFLDS